jgi:ClpP class serine protease
MDLFLGVLSGGAAVTTLVASWYLMKLGYSKFSKRSLNNNIKKNNAIPIVHADDSSIFTVITSGGNVSHIDTKCYTDFIKAYELITKDNDYVDITIVMYTHGGSLSSSEAIANTIFNHRGKGKITCIIPYYAYSGGFFIALCCDKIVMFKNAIVGPCDAQTSMGKTGTYSVASVIHAVEHKKDAKENIKEEWLAEAHNSQLARERQKKFMDKLVEEGRYEQDVCDRIYNEFFAGKHNHDKVFSARVLTALGINVEIADTMPSFIKDFVDE